MALAVVQAAAWSSAVVPPLVELLRLAAVLLWLVVLLAAVLLWPSVALAVVQAVLLVVRCE